MLPRPKPVVAVAVHVAAVVVAATMAAGTTVAAIVVSANAAAATVVMVPAVVALAVSVAGTKPGLMELVITVATTPDIKAATAQPDTTAPMERKRVFEPVLESTTTLRASTLEPV